MLRRLAPNVWILGLVSLATDLSSEMLYPLIPLFLTQTLGAAPAVVGLIEGAAEMTASLLRGFSGVWSDRSGRRKPLVVAGYALSAAAKTLLALVTAWPGVLAVRVADRFGKGLRATARDAMLAESCEERDRGAAFGLHRSMDQVGAVLGPLAAIPLLAWAGGSFRTVFLVAAIPALAGVALLAAAKETGAGGAGEAVRSRIGIRSLPRTFWLFLALWLPFTLGNSADAFLLLRAQNLGASNQQTILLFALFNAVTVAASFPGGWLSDKAGRKPVLLAGLGAFALAYGAIGAGRPPLWAAFAVYGVYAAVAEGALRALIVDLVPAQMKASALGAFGMITGVLTLCANLLAGWLWQAVSPAAPFIAGAAGALITLALLAAAFPKPDMQADVD